MISWIYCGFVTGSHFQAVCRALCRDQLAPQTDPETDWEFLGKAKRHPNFVEFFSVLLLFLAIFGKREALYARESAHSQ